MISDRTAAPEMRRALLIFADGQSKEYPLPVELSHFRRVQLAGVGHFSRVCEDGLVLVYVQEKP